MKAQDLRIGNFVWDDYSGEMIVANIWAEHYPEVLVDIRKSDKLPCGRYDIDSIKPIPLTEEWLLKLPDGLDFPDWIKNVHTLQNWYFYQNKCEKDLEFK